MKRFLLVINSGEPRCGNNAALKLDNGLLPICNPDDAGMHCCSPAGYCGNTDEFCECDGCVDFKKMSDSAIEDWMRGPLSRENGGFFTDIEIGNQRPDFFTILPTNNVAIFPIWPFGFLKRTEATRMNTPLLFPFIL